MCVCVCVCVCAHTTHMSEIFMGMVLHLSIGEGNNVWCSMVDKVNENVVVRSTFVVVEGITQHHMMVGQQTVRKEVTSGLHMFVILSFLWQTYLAITLPLPTPGFSPCIIFRKFSGVTS